MKGLAEVIAALLFCIVLASGKISLDRNRIAGPRQTFTFKNHTYEVSNFKENWESAKYYCKWLDMDLVSIETEEEQLAIVENMGDLRENFWISLNDIMEEGVFYWESTGAEVGPYTFWGINEPSAGTGYGCTVIRLHTGGHWDVGTCATDDTYRYICESRDC